MRIKKNRRSFVVEPASAGTYASGDAIGALQSLSGAVEGSDQSGELDSLVIVDTDNQSTAMDILFYQAQVTGGTDNVAYAPDASEVLECVGLISVDSLDYVTVGARSVATPIAGLGFQLAQSTTLYVQVVSRGTPTYTAANSLRLNFVIAAD